MYYTIFLKVLFYFLLLLLQGYIQKVKKISKALCFSISSFALSCEALHSSVLQITIVELVFIEKAAPMISTKAQLLY